MKKYQFCALLSALALCIGLCGCIPLPSIVTPPSPTKYLNEFADNWQYRYLTQEERACYGSIYTALTDGMDTDETVSITDSDEEPKTDIGIQIKLPHTVQSTEDMTRLFNAFFRDNPHFFYISNNFRMQGYSTSEGTYYDTLVLAYTMTTAQRKEAAAQLETAIDTLLKDRPDTTDEYLTELHIHDRLIAHCTYDYTAADSPHEDNPTAYTAYGALVEGTAVCEGYARAMQLLLKRCGIHSTLVVGQSVESDEGHMWNMVTVNGCNYHLDATWDDAEDRPRHTYFNLTTEQISLTHRIDNPQTGIDTCSATTDHYFVRNATYIDTYERQSIAAAIAARINAGDTTVELRFSPETFDNGLLFIRNASLLSQRVSPLLNGDIDKLWDYTISGNSQQYVLTITKSEE